jgi:hypothetical protein
MWRENRYFIIAGFFLTFGLNLILPFKSIYSSGVSIGLFGGVTQNPPSTKFFSGFQEPQVIALQAFFFVTLILIALSRKRIVVIFSIITAFLNAVSLPVVYFSLTFHLTFFGPSEDHSAEIGFYLLILINLLLIIYTFLLVRNYPKNEKPKESEELLDF